MRASKKVLFAACLAALVAVASQAFAAWDCTWDNASYDNKGWLSSVQIFRDGNRIADITHMDTLGAYYISCKGIPRTESFNTANDAAWAACWRCQ